MNFEPPIDKGKNKTMPASGRSVHFRRSGFPLEDHRERGITQKKGNNTGLPGNLKAGIENLSGHSMDDVKVHYNSDKPAQLNAHAYAQGNQIYLASGQEKHLPHEAWHVVQQKQGRVKPTMQLKGKLNVNDDEALEKEADVMGTKAAANVQSAIRLKTFSGEKNTDTKEIVVQRLALAAAPGEFNTALALSQRNDEFGAFDNEYYAKEDEPEKGRSLEEINTAFRALWESCLTPGYPATLKKAVEEWSEALDDTLGPIFNTLKTITNLPGSLANDTVHLDLGNHFDELVKKLQANHLPVSGAGFHTFILNQLPHFAAIRAKLLAEPAVLQQLWEGDTAGMRIAFHALGADNHGYAPPTKLTLTDATPRPAKSLVYKARPGEADKLVTDLFRDLNACLRMRSDARLPAYKQALFHDKHLLSEFIEGPAIDTKVQAFSGVANSIDKIAVPADRKELQANIMLLEAVAKQIGLTDLHEENLILNTQAKQVVPIDLEAFTTGKPQDTGLYGDSKAAPDVQHLLPDGAHDLIENFKIQLDGVERRVVPVATGALANMMQQQNAVALAAPAIQKSLEKNNFTVHTGLLEAYIRRCKQQAALTVPSFTVIRGDVLCSAVGAGKIIIAKRNDEHRKKGNFLWANIDPLFAPFEKYADMDPGLDYYKNPFKHIVSQLMKPGTGTIASMRKMVLQNSDGYQYVFILAPLASYADSIEKNRKDIGKPFLDADAGQFADIARDIIISAHRAIEIIRKSLD